MNNIKILYVDSQEKFGQDFLSFLLQKGYDVKYITSFKDALIEYSFHQPDILISDVELQDGSGLHLIQKIKKINKTINTLLLTKSADQALFMEVIALKIDALNFKGDSYETIEKQLSKFDIVRTIEEPEEHINRLEFDLGENHIYKDNMIVHKDKAIKLTTQENNLIQILTEAKGMCVSYEVLQNSLSVNNQTSIDTIRTVIRKIRKKTFNDIIKNQSGMGYKVNYFVSNASTSLYSEELTKFDVRILILKGDNQKNELLAYQLEKFGFKCESACTISQAKTLLLYQKYDYIITDLNLPDGESIDFIREFEELYSTKVIILSSNKDIHYKDYLYFRGILDYIVDINDTSILALTLYKTIAKVENNTKFNQILVIEHSKKISEQIKDLLLPRNYHVDMINDLDHAYELLKTNTYSLVILDINFEKCFDFIVNVKNNIEKSLHFIVLSDASRTYSTVRLAYTNGASECLRKPIFAEEFILKVDQLVDSSKLIFELIEKKKLLEDYRTIVDQSAIISKTDPKGIITYVNQIFTDISGYTQEELLGKQHNIIRHPEMPKEVFKTMWKTIKEKKQIWTGVVKNRAKDGSTYYVQTSIMPILDKNGEIKEFIALRNDISSVYDK